jgi:WD40 repeat protein
MLASGSFDGSAYVWDTDSVSTEPIIRLTTASKSPVYSISFNSSVTLLATGHSGGLVTLWDVGTTSQLHSIRLFDDIVRSVDFSVSTGASNLLSCGGDVSVWLWDIDSVWNITVDVIQLEGHADIVTGTCFTGDDRWLLSSSLDGTICVWNYRQYSETSSVSTLKGHSSGILSFALNMHGNRVVSGSEDFTVVVWGFDNDTCIGTILSVLDDHCGPVNCVGFSADDMMIVSSSYDYSAIVHDAETGAVISEAEFENSVYAVRFNAANSHYVATSYCGDIHFVEASTGTITSCLRGHEGAVYCARFAPILTILM